MGKKLFFLSVMFCWLPANGFSVVSEDWEKHVIGPQSSPIYLYVMDMDSDGDLDVVSTTDRHPLAWVSEVAWFRNNLDQGTPWDKFIISSSAPEDNPIMNTNGIMLADIDGDGRDDAAGRFGKSDRKPGKCILV